MSYIKDIVYIDKNIFSTSEDNVTVHHVIFKNANNNLVTGLLSADKIWKFYFDNDLVETLDIDTFLYFSKHCDNEEYIESKKKIIVEKLKNDSSTKLDNNIDLIKIKHENPIFTFTKKMNRKGTRIISQYIKLKLEKSDIGEYVFKLKNNFKKENFFVSLKIIDSNDKLIELNNIDQITFITKKILITKWFGQCLLKNEEFKMDNLFPLFEKNYYFVINTDFKIKEVYAYLCYETAIPKQIFENYELLDFEFEKIYYDDVIEEIEFENINGYYKELRICLIDNISGKKIDCNLIDRISIENLVNDIPTDLLIKEENILIFDYGKDVIKFDDMSNSTGFTLGKFKINLKFNSKIYNMNVREIKLAIFGKKHVYFNLKSINNNLELDIDV